MNDVLAPAENPTRDDAGAAHARRPAIVALFQRQKLRNPNKLECVDVGPAWPIDVTDVVLLKSARELHNLRDSHPSSDAMVPYGRHLYNGIYRVELTASIKSYFAVSNLSDIDQSMLDAALQEHTRFTRAKSAQKTVAQISKMQQTHSLSPAI